MVSWLSPLQPPLLLVCSSLFLSLPKPCAGFVIAPAWANPLRNPCSSSSWQLVYWPPARQCFNIFSQGPCPDTQVLGYDPVNEKPVCQCPKELPLLWRPTGRCYSRYSRGPCQVNQYLDLARSDDEVVGGGDSKTAEASDDVAERPVCVTSKRCEPGWAFWPADRRCHRLYSQGPCHKGDLLILNPLTAEPFCGCDSGINHF